MCCEIGDEASLKKHLSKQTAAGNNRAAQRLLAACEEITAIRSEINNNLQQFEGYGFQRIYTICNKIKDSKFEHFTYADTWELCALSGRQSKSTLVIHTDNSLCHIEREYDRFARSLWFVFNIHKIIQDEIANWLQHGKPATIASRIQNFLESYDDVITRICHIFINCLEMVADTIAQTMEELQKRKLVARETRYKAAKADAATNEAGSHMPPVPPQQL